MNIKEANEKLEKIATGRFYTVQEVILNHPKLDRVDTIHTFRLYIQNHKTESIYVVGNSWEDAFKKLETSDEH